MADGQFVSKRVTGGSAVVGSISFQDTDDQTATISFQGQQFTGNLYTVNLPSIAGNATLGSMLSMSFSAFMIAAAAFTGAYLVVIADSTVCYVFSLSSTSAQQDGKSICGSLPIITSSTGVIQFMVTGMASGFLEALALMVTLFNFSQPAAVVQGL
jgi:hypothetical protein